MVSRLYFGTVYSTQGWDTDETWVFLRYTSILRIPLFFAIEIMHFHKAQYGFLGQLFFTFSAHIVELVSGLTNVSDVVI